MNIEEALVEDGVEPRDARGVLEVRSASILDISRRAILDDVIPRVFG
jgi:hypothetical protein